MPAGVRGVWARLAVGGWRGGVDPSRWRPFSEAVAWCVSVSLVGDTGVCLPRGSLCAGYETCTVHL